MGKFRFWVLAAVCVLLLVVVFNLLAPGRPRRAGQFVAYSDVLTEAAAGRLRAATLQGRMLTATTAEGRTVQAYLPDDPGLANRLAGQGVRVSALPEDDGDPVVRAAVSWLPSLLFLLAWWLSLRQVAAELRALRAAVERLPAWDGRGPPQP